MIDALIGSFTVFDAIVFAVVILSALMALSRGFMRELATLAALFFGSVAAYFGRLYFRDTIENLLPETSHAYAADLIVVVAAFLIVYIIVRVLGGRFTNIIQKEDGVGIVDRFAGLVFGVARGLALPFLTAWFIINTAPTETLPDFISKSATYPSFERAAYALNANQTGNVTDQPNTLQTRPAPSSPDE